MDNDTQSPAIAGGIPDVQSNDRPALVYVCGGRSADVFPMEGMLAVGFGEAKVTRDGEVVYSEMAVTRKHENEHGEDGDWPPFWHGHDAESAALADPDHDWQITINGPLSGGIWKRMAPGVWKLQQDLGGFA
jgi:hypothetical protein